jgi:hypothetical protein
MDSDRKAVHRVNATVSVHWTTFATVKVDNANVVNAALLDANVSFVAEKR